MQQGFVLTTDEAKVLRSASATYESPFYDIAVSNLMVPSQVEQIFGQLEKKRLANRKGQSIVLTPDGRLAKNYLRVRNSPYISIDNFADSDNQKGKWGGKSTSNDRALSATVKEAGDDWYDLTLTVATTDDAKPLTGKVIFKLHDTFAHPERTVEVVNDRAELRLPAWGAFTVGAVADEGQTTLELDLSELADAPAEFRAK